MRILDFCIKVVVVAIVLEILIHSAANTFCDTYERIHKYENQRP